MNLSPQEEQLARILDFDEDVLRLVKSELQRPVEPFEQYFSTVDGSEVIYSSADIFDGKCFVVKLANEYAGSWEPAYLELIHRMRSLLTPYGYMAFLTEAYNPQPCLTVLKTLDEYEIIRVVKTGGWDFDDKQWQPEELIGKLQEWKGLCNFSVIGADRNNIKLKFITLPHHLVGFAEEVCCLCWEILDQVYDFDGMYGEDTVQNRWLAEQLAQEIQRTNRVYLWWD